MSVARTVDFGGTDDELAKYLLEFAGRLRALVARDRRKGAPERSWILSAGAWLSPNPNSLPFRLRIRREGSTLHLEPTAVAFPWTRAKTARILAFRQGQLADYLTQRSRGSGPEKFDELRLREPFAPYGGDAAALTASYTWAAASGLAALAAAVLAGTAVFLPLLALAGREIAERASALSGAGGLVLPSPAELAGRGAGALLGSAFVFAFPIAFLGGLLHALALAVADLHVRASRIPQSSFLFLALLVGVGLFPYFPFLCWPLALVFPAAIHAAHTFVWARRRERVREGPRPRRLVTAAGFVLAIGLLGGVMPKPAASKDLTDRIALFRDKVLLGHPLGRQAALFYYRHTLFAADPLKEFYTVDEQRAVRAQRIAVCPREDAAAALRALDFSVLSSGAVYDVMLGDRGLSRDGVVIPLKNPADRQELRRALSDLSARTFRGGPLRDVSWLGWQALYLGGPVAALLLFLALSTPFVSVLFRVLQPKAALITLTVCLLSTFLTMLWAESRSAGGTEALAALREKPDAERLRPALTHASVAVRHEAAYRASQLPDTAALADALLQAVDDADFRVRLWACAALGRSKDPRAYERLVARLSDREFFVRYRAAEGLGLLKDVRAEGALVKMVRDGTWYEGLYALHALRRLRPERY